MAKRSTVDSKDYMAEALLFLMKRKPAAKITVQEITERAGVSRATWFRHFTDKREAVVYGLARLWEKWAESHGLTDPHRPSVENVESFVDYIYDIRSIQKALERSEMESAILDAYVRVLVDSEENTGTEEYFRNKALTYGIVGIIDGWRCNDYRNSREEIAAYLRKFIAGRCAP